jgi:hypothetical protein
VAELEEASLLHVRILVGVELGRDRQAGRIDRVGEVHPLEAAVLEGLSGDLRAADRIAERGRRGGAERLIRVAVVGERPVDADRVRHDLAEHALRDADLRALDVERPLRIEEVVHVRRQPEAVGELVVHRVGRVEDDEHVCVRAGVRLQELPVVRSGRRGDQERQQPGHRGPVSGRKPGESVGRRSIAHDRLLEGDVLGERPDLDIGD